MGLFDSIASVFNPVASATLGGLAGSLDLTGDRARGDALNSQMDMYGDIRAFYNPYQQAGVDALGRIKSGQFEMDPSYQFRMSEGLKALQNAATARGGGRSGATLKALTRYGQDLASQEYGNQFNRNMSLANLGFGAAQGLSNAAGSIGDARAASAMGGYNSKMNLLGQGLSLGTMALGLPPMGGAIAPQSNNFNYQSEMQAMPNLSYWGK